MLSIVWKQDGVTATRTPEDGELQTFACDVHMCSSALCQCTDVNLRLTPTNDAARAAWPGLDSIAVNVDPYAEVSIEELEDPDAGADSNSARFAAEFSPETWEELVMQFMDVKQAAINGRIRKLIFDLVSRTYGKWNPRMRHKLAKVKEAVYPCDWENHERPP